MFGLFSSSKEKKFRNNEKKIQAGSSEDTVNMTSLLVLSMSKYLGDVYQKVSSRNAVYPECAYQQYERLKEIGLGSTANAMELKKEIDRYESVKSDYNKAFSLVSFVKNVHNNLSKDSILVSSEQFDNVCATYGLSVAPLVYYSGVIPEKNIRDIENVMNNMYRFDDRKYLNGTRGGNMMFVDSISAASDDIKNIERYVDSNNRMIVVNDNGHFERLGYVYGCDIVGDIRFVYDHLVQLSGKIMTYKDMMIACPKEYIKADKVKVSTYLVDPIVFQYTPYGILVHTVWGEEAEDAVLKQYMELNLKIDNM